MRVKIALILILTFFISDQSHAFFYQKPAIQQGLNYQKDKNTNRDIKQYYISEKLDGMRGYWNGKQLLTRQGNVINSPIWFTQGWPNTPIDGELWISRNNFQPLMSCVRKKTAGTCWEKVRFMMFDLPQQHGNFSARIKQMQDILMKTPSPYLQIIKQFKVKSLSELEAKLEQVMNNKGEGLMLHFASAHYHVGRTTNLLKLKKNQDAEAIVIEHIKGKGKYQQVLGSIKVKNNQGIIFKIGSGFTDSERANPPAIGSMITYKYNGITMAGKPRFARYWRIRTK